MQEKHKYSHVLSEFVRTNGVEREHSLSNYATFLIALLEDRHQNNTLAECVNRFQHMHCFIWRYVVFNVLVNGRLPLTSV